MDTNKNDEPPVLFKKNKEVQSALPPFVIYEKIPSLLVRYNNLNQAMLGPKYYGDLPPIDREPKLEEDIIEPDKSHKYQKLDEDISDSENSHALFSQKKRKSKFKRYGSFNENSRHSQDDLNDEFLLVQDYSDVFDNEISRETYDDEKEKSKKRIRPRKLTWPYLKKITRAEYDHI
ncbi:hypothetical protein HZS_6424 [Henneguya salminicola]|nr:hypothetical protein HZS_6424 [Henneguya salminicola]